MDPLRVYQGNMRRLITTANKVSDGTPVDPTTLSLLVRSPGGQVTQYDYSQFSGIIIKDSVGIYHADVLLNLDGWWEYDWVGDGAAVYTAGGRIYVYPLNTSIVTNPGI